jgi:hypothetical protein
LQTAPSVFANSDFFHKGENGTLFPKWTKKIVIQRGETDLPVTIIADLAYPLKPWIITIIGETKYLLSSFIC